MNKKVLFYGDIGVDIILQTHSVPHSAQDTAVQDAHTLPGGSAANSAVDASHLNIQASIMGLIGDDLYHDLLINDLQAHGVDTGLLKTVQGKNTLVTALLADNGSHVFCSYRGVSGTQPYGPFPQNLTGAYDCVHISGYSLQDRASRQTALGLIQDAINTRTLLSLDPASIFASSPQGCDPDLIASFDIIMPNLQEAQAMSGKSDPHQAAIALRETGVSIVLIKMGANGCLLSCASSTSLIPAYPLQNPINTIGAGDAFCAGFLAAYLNGQLPEDAARWANAAAHIVIQGTGGHDHPPAVDQIQNLIASSVSG